MAGAVRGARPAIALLATLFILAGPSAPSRTSGPSASVVAAVSRANPSALPSAPASPSALPQAAPSAVPLATTPLQTPLLQVVPAAQLHEQAAQPGSKRPFFLGRRQVPSSSSRGAIPPSVAPANPHSSSTAAAPGIVLYNNLNSPGMSATVDSGDVTPPDSTGAIGPNHYVEMVNSQIAVWRRDLTSVSTASLPTWVGVAPGPSYCDPQVQWDPTAGRWLYVFLFCNAAANSQDFHFGWSKTSDPSDLVNGWCHFGVTTGSLLFDYPKLGHNSNYLIVGANNFDETMANPPFVSAAIDWIPLPANGDTSCTLPASVSTTPSPLLNGDGTTPTFTPVPVNTITAAADGYVVSAYDPSGPPPTTQSKLAVWHLDAGGVLHQDPDIPVAAYTAPSPALQLNGGTSVIDTLDGRLTQAVGDPVAGIWTQHTVNGAGGRSTVEWFEIKAGISGPTLFQEGGISSGTDFVFNGAISPRFDGAGAAVFYNRSGSSIDPLIAAQTRLSSTPAGAMDPGELVLASSGGADKDFSCNNPTPGIACRWGDYSAATPDPVLTNVVWGTNERTLAPSGLSAEWEDQNFAILLLPTRAAAQAPAPTPPASRPSANPLPLPAPSPSPR
jgi:hypothetical protein